MSDIIAAIATGKQPCAIGILRLSGEGCAEAAGKVFVCKNGKPLSEAPDRALVLGTLYDLRGRELDQAQAVFCRGPHSYTGEDTVELQCHGSPAVLTAGLEALCRAGARIARPGEPGAGSAQSLQARRQHGGGAVTLELHRVLTGVGTGPGAADRQTVIDLPALDVEESPQHQLPLRSFRERLPVLRCKDLSRQRGAVRSGQPQDPHGAGLPAGGNRRNDIAHTDAPFRLRLPYYIRKCAAKQALFGCFFLRRLLQ